jgi:hypothetical protein
MAASFATASGNLCKSGPASPLERKEPMGDDKEIRIMFARDERGWGVLFAPDRAQIASIPLTDDFNIDDTVEVKRIAGSWDTFKIVRVIDRKFDCKTAIVHEPRFGANFAALASAWMDAGMRCEGLMDGVVLIAHHKHQDPMELAKQTGIPFKLYDPQPRLRPLPRKVVTKHHHTVADIIDKKIDCPLPLEVIPNYMGINLCSVDAVSWERQDDDQLVSLTIHFSPAEGCVHKFFDPSPPPGQLVPCDCSDSCSCKGRTCLLRA